MTVAKLTEADRTLYSARLVEAEQALHDLKLGNKARVVVDQNGERVEFAVASAERLRAYTVELRTALGMPTGVSGPLQSWML